MFYVSVLASSESSIAAMLLELCVIELEDVALNNNILFSLPQPVIQESAHPYSNQITTSGVVRIPGMLTVYRSVSRDCLLVENVRVTYYVRTLDR